MSTTAAEDQPDTKPDENTIMKWKYWIRATFNHKLPLINTLNYCFVISKAALKDDFH